MAASVSITWSFVFSVTSSGNGRSAASLMYELSSFMTVPAGVATGAKGIGDNGSVLQTGMAAPVRAKPAHFRTDRRVGALDGSEDIESVCFNPIQSKLFSRESPFPLAVFNPRCQTPPICNAMASPISRVVALPPMSGVRALEEARVAAIADSMVSAAPP